MSDPQVAESTVPAPPPAAPSLWRSVRQALRGEEHDYTSLRLNRAVLLLAVPMVLEMVMESVFALADIFWVSHLGKEAIAVVGMTESIMAIVYAVAIGIAIAATAVVARRIGEQDPERASHAAGQVLLLGFGLAAGIGVVMGWLAPDILRLMGASPEVVALGARFARVMLGGNVTVFMIFVINAIFRGAGDAVIAMRTLWLANVFNIVLGPLFIFGLGPIPALGVTGAAIATNCGRGLGVLYQLWHLTGRPGRLRVQWRHLRFDREVMVNVLRPAGNGILQLLIATTSWLGLFTILAPFGSAAVAGYTVAIRVVIFALMPAWGLANAGATLVGQNLGAQKPERAEAAVRLAAKYNMLFLGIVGLLFIAFAQGIITVLTTGRDQEVIAIGTRALWIMSLAFPLYAAGMCLEGAFNGAGDTRTPTRLNFFCYWLGQIPLAWVLASPHGLNLGPTGVFIAVPVSFSVLAIWSAVLFKRGAWKLKKV